MAQTTPATILQLVGAVEVLKGDLSALAHGLLTLADPDTGVEELLVGLVLTIGVADGAHKVVLLVQNVVTDTAEVSVLHVGVDVDLDDTVADSLLVLLLGGAGAAVEDKEDGLLLLGLGLLLDVGLVLLEELGVQADVAGLVDTVDVTEASGDREVGGDGGEGVVDGQDILGLSVEGVVVDILVVDTVLLTTGDTNLLKKQKKPGSVKLYNRDQRGQTYHLEPLLHGGSTLEVSGSGGDVPVNGLLGQVDHVGREEGLAVELEVALILIHHAVEPGEELLGAVIGVEDDGNAVGGGNGADVVSSGDGTSDGGGLAIVADTLTGEESGTTLGDLEGNGGLLVASGLEGSHDGGGRGDVLVVRLVSQCIWTRAGGRRIDFSASGSAVR